LKCFREINPLSHAIPPQQSLDYSRTEKSIKALKGDLLVRGEESGLLKGSEKHLVHCKQWRALEVGVKVVRGLKTIPIVKVL